MDTHNDSRLPGSDGEHRAQRMYGTTRRAENFYKKQVLDYLNDRMRAFIADQDFAFISTADKKGECDCSFRAGLVNTLHVLSDRKLIFPEYRGNGVMASAGNIMENPHMGMLFIDFSATIGLHINGKASVVGNDATEVLMADHNIRLDRELLSRGRKPEFWFCVEVEEAYIHCSKHIPMMQPIDREIDWGTDDTLKKGGDAFGAKSCPRPWVPDKVEAE